MKNTKEPALAEYPFAEELITDVRGHVSKIVLAIPAYRKLLDAIEDAGLYRAMQKTRKEKDLTKDEALTILSSPPFCIAERSIVSFPDDALVRRPKSRESSEFCRSF